jgi:predicted O-methyltransferase YrrM
MLVCKHGTTTEQALKLIKNKLKELGYDEHVEWNGHNALVSIVFGTILRIKGKITNREVIVEFGGAFGNSALQQCREIVRDIFPSGQLV